MVVRSAPFQRTFEVLMKLDPYTVRVRAPLFIVADGGLILVMTGSGLSAGLMVKVTPFDVPPPGTGFNTVTVALPAVAMSAALMLAVNCVLEI